MYGLCGFEFILVIGVIMVMKLVVNGVKDHTCL